MSDPIEFRITKGKRRGQTVLATLETYDPIKGMLHSSHCYACGVRFLDDRRFNVKVRRLILQRGSGYVHDKCVLEWRPTATPARKEFKTEQEALDFSKRLRQGKGRGTRETFIGAAHDCKTGKWYLWKHVYKRVGAGSGMDYEYVLGADSRWRDSCAYDSVNF